MQWIPSLVTSAGVLVAMIALGWQVYFKLDSKIDSKFDALREEMQAGFREIDQRFDEIDRRFEEMITAMGSMSERLAALEARARTRHACYRAHDRPQRLSGHRLDPS